MAGIFDIFTVLFKSDTDEAADGVKKLDNNVEALAKHVDKAGDEMSELDRKTNQAANNQFDFLDFSSRLSGLAAGYLSIATIVNGFMQAVDFSDQLGEFADSIGKNVEEVSAWSDAAVMSGGSAQGFQSSLGSLSRAVTEFGIKGKSRLQPFFQELGISMVDAAGGAKDVFQLLEETAGAFEKIGRQQSFAIGQKLGLDAGTIQLLQRGNQGIAELIERQKELGIVTQEQAEAAGAFNDSLDDTAHAFRSLYSQLLLDLQPAFSGFLEIIQDVIIFMRQHSNVVVGASVALLGMAAAFTATKIAAAAFLLPLLRVAGIFAAIAIAVGLAYDDIKTFFEGGNSLLGQFIDKFPTLFINQQTFRDSLVGLFDDITASIKAMWYALTHPGESLSSIASNIESIFKPLVDGLPNVSDIFGDAVNAFALATNPLGYLVSPASIAGAANSQSTVNVGKIEINTQATDAEGISRDIDNRLRRELRQAAASTDNGVAY